MSSTARYAIYVSPEYGSPLWRYGSAVIGYDAVARSSVRFPPGAPFDADDWASLTEEPRRYGFHGTLKAPFSLRDGASEADLLRAVGAFAEDRHSFAVSALEVAMMGAFAALVPGTPVPALDRLAADCVRVFDPFRSPLSAADRERRLASPLSVRQRRYLDEWGYPFVFDEFRFHMTLTGPLPSNRREDIRAALARAFEDVQSSLVVDAVTVFRQDDRREPFHVVERFLFGSQNAQR